MAENDAPTYNRRTTSSKSDLDVSGGLVLLPDLEHPQHLALGNLPLVLRVAELSAFFRLPSALQKLLPRHRSLSRPNFFLGCRRRWYRRRRWRG